MHREASERSYNMAYSLTAVERESVITFNAAEENADIYASDPVWIRKFDKLVEQNPEQFKVIQEFKYEGKVVARRYTFPKSFLTVRSKKRENHLTDEQKEAAAKRLLLGRKTVTTIKSDTETL